MRKVIIWLAVAVALILIGSIVFTSAMMGLQWDFSKLSTEEYETNEYTLTQPFQNIAINTDTTDVTLVKTTDENATVTCYEYAKEKHKVEIVDGTLMIQLTETRNWYDYISIRSKSQKITIVLPGKQYETLSVKTSTGDICIQDISASTLNLSVTTGDTALSNIQCQAIITQGDTGSISLENTAATENLSIARTTGDVELTGCNTAQLFVKTDTGDVELQRSDAGEIFIETNTGDVKGSLLTEKIFIANSDTGRIDVPKTAAGGKCEITTDTGDIKFEIA